VDCPTVLAYSTLSRTEGRKEGVRLRLSAGGGSGRADRVETGSSEITRVSPL